MIKEAILKVVNGNDLNAKEAYGAMDEIMSGEASEVQMSAYLTALSMKGETIEEITASTKAMRAHCVKLLNDEEVLEIVGTGGDGSNTFNISTTSSIVISAAGVPVAKHGNRSASSKCGAADVLEALGVNIYIEPEKSLKILKEINLCFLFAQNYHLAMKFVAGVRKELSIRTIFNILGPLSNPAASSSASPSGRGSGRFIGRMALEEETVATTISAGAAAARPGRALGKSERARPSASTCVASPVPASPTARNAAQIPCFIHRSPDPFTPYAGG